MTLELKHVAVPTFELVSGAGRQYGPRARDGRDLRRRLVLRPDAQVLFVSVARDPEIERYWAHATELNLPERLAALGLWGMTAPNFSFFDDMPRTQILYNTARIVRATEALSKAGVPSVLHLNALTKADLRFWVSLLRDHPQMVYVAKEFQTGARSDRVRAERMIDGLEFIQARVPQELRPIVIGGTQYTRRLVSSFPRATFIDSRPFMNAVNRQRFVFDAAGARWEKCPTAPDEPIDDLLASNIAAYSRYVAALGNGAIDDAAAACVEASDESLTEDE
ncbi:DUF4417 domain-containing protein [Sandaracinus amylolyticus]|uniref:DUF4417 domain-containing protein n=1 Tax=Sandaracinus amylolyticus TaxID=927083 RepID=UPI001F381A4A|nr:DUF4417 domain-containing protein [Sandaracinus amylolyticus]